MRFNGLTAKNGESGEKPVNGLQSIENNNYVVGKASKQEIVVQDGPHEASTIMKKLIADVKDACYCYIWGLDTKIFLKTVESDPTTL